MLGTEYLDRNLGKKQIIGHWTNNYQTGVQKNERIDQKERAWEENADNCN